MKMMRLDARIARLEQHRATAGTGACAACGWPLPVSVMPRFVKFHVPPPRLLGSLPADTARDCCAACGRRLVYRIPSPRLVERAV